MVCSYLKGKIKIQESSILSLILSKFGFQFKSTLNKEEKIYHHLQNSNSKLKDILLKDGWDKSNPNRDNEGNSN